ncbi:MAG: inositol 2-dehydrogenase [Spirochaetaceae bacterium]|nr:MAG: inositol 2-dehydrogenase [Spirochaetaceae bacterium]
MSKKIRTLVLGGGRIGELHARNVLTYVPKMQLVAVVDPMPTASLRLLCADSNTPVVAEATDYLRNADAVIVATPTVMHEGHVTKALEAGLHVMCEKPLAGDLAAANRMLTAASSSGKVLQVGFNRRFDRNFMALRDAVVNGSVGTVESLRITSRDPAPPGIEYIQKSGGLFMDMSIHDFDMARFLTGDEVVSVYAKGACLVDDEIGRNGDIDTAVITLTFAGGALGVIENSRRATYGYDQRAGVHGSRGAAESGNNVGSSVVISDSGGVHGEKPLYFFLERYRESFVAELNAFADAIIGAEPPRVSGRDGIEAMRIAEACRRSHERGCEVALSEVE